MNKSVKNTKNQNIKQIKNIRLLNFFTKHPTSVGETYLEHFLVAIGFSIKLLVASIAAFIHAFLPSFFKTFASEHIKKMYEQITMRKSH